ncbi:MAG: ABC transporter ATP-binding protein [Rectinema subterraneum]|uniref:ABC transporter ATP-binding protein n=1 Tax=Rectinema subterraneum TaxID=2653714 RepID=UPI003C79C3D4
MTTPALELVEVTKIFQKDKEKVKAVDSVSLSVSKGEMVIFLGPSGCGKTTTLRMIAGFELPTSGRISIDGAEMTNVPVNKRGIGFVFQNYALFPHMSVFNNVAYGLRSRGEVDSIIQGKVNDALALVGLANAGNRYPNQLSGGEQQRVALARVLVMEPKLLLMDEPLSNLDAKLRIYMRTEIRRIQKKLGITCLYVTHDQAEALTMADRIMVMNKGRVEQVGTPYDLYSQPQSLFVADFIGQANILKVPVTGIHGETVQAAMPGGWVLSARATIPERIEPGKNASLVIRPENVLVVSKAQKEGHLPARVMSAIFMGSHIEYHLDLGDMGSLIAFSSFKPGMHIFNEDDEVSVVLDSAVSMFLPA